MKTIVLKYKNFIVYIIEPTTIADKRASIGTFEIQDRFTDTIIYRCHTDGYKDIDYITKKSKKEVCNYLNNVSMKQWKEECNTTYKYELMPDNSHYDGDWQPYRSNNR